MSRAGFKFTEQEFMTMPVRRFRKYYDAAIYFFEKQREEYEAARNST